MPQIAAPIKAKAVAVVGRFEFLLLTRPCLRHPWPSRNIGDQFRTGVLHKKYCYYSIAYIWNEILNLCLSHYPVLPKQIRQDNLAPLLLSCHQGRGRGGRARPLITSKPIGTERKPWRYVNMNFP